VAVTGFEIRSRTPFADGAAFGAAGPYDRVEGLVSFAVDPSHPANRPIVDLDRAERGPDGLVHFTSDFCILQPHDPARSSGSLLYMVANRGRMGAVPLSGGAYPTQVTDRIEPGDGWLLKRGWTVAWCGWQWDVIRRPGVVGLQAPQALEDGRPIQGQVMVEFQPNEAHPDQLLAHFPLHPPPGDVNVEHQPYPAADVNDPDAIMTVREWGDGPRTVIPRQQWRFARDQAGQPVQDDTRVWIEGGFRAGLIYNVVYRTRICPVVGTGLLAMRDVVSFLRYGSAADGNPCAGQVDATFAYGASQSGRFLRTYLYHGLNQDEAGRQSLDGIHAHVGSARLGEFNQRYGQPSIHHTIGFGHRGPFAGAEQVDPVNGRDDGVLTRQRSVGCLPKVIYTNSSSEYWYSHCSLIHTDPLGDHDVEPAAEERIYLLAGTRHNAGTVPMGDQALFGGRTANGQNVVNSTALMRGKLINLERWVRAGEEPPPSAFPRLADGTAVSPSEVMAAFSNVPGAALANVERLPHLGRVDLGPDADRGIGRFPPALGERYASYVSALDADLNETAGVRMPDLTVPVGSHTGWNPRHPSTGGEGQILDTAGSTIPFPRDAAERARTGDPRPSIAERYASRDEYLARVRTEVDRLIAERHLLAEDAEAVVQLAADRYDAFTRTGAIDAVNS